MIHTPLIFHLPYRVVIVSVSLDRTIDRPAGSRRRRSDQKDVLQFKVDVVFSPTELFDLISFSNQFMTEMYFFFFFFFTYSSSKDDELL